MSIQDIKILTTIKNKLGGSIKIRSGSNSIRYRLHNKEDMLSLINRINGHIRYENRLTQLNELCKYYKINLIESEPLNLNNS